MTSLDIVRGLAALAVFVTHWDGWTVRGDRGSLPDVAVAMVERAIGFFWYGGGIHPGVIAFIVLSGFCIHLPLARAAVLADAPGFWREYASRRAWRIGPVYLVATLLGFGATWLAMSSSPPLPMEIHPPSVFGIVASLLGVTALLQPWQGRVFFHSGNEPLGTVTREILLYASYPLLIWLRRRTGAWVIFALGLAGYGLIVVLRMQGVPPVSLHGSYLEFLLYWLLGAGAAESLYAFRSSAKRDLAFTALAWSALIAWSFFAAFKGAHVVRTVLFAVAVAVLLRALVDWEQQRSQPPGTLALWFSKTGERSYSLYAVHMPVLIALLFLQQALGLTGQDVGLRWLSLAIVLAAAELMFRVVERPAHQKGRGA